jgi:hypothetical protein
MSKPKIGYMCATDFAYHLDGDISGSRVFPDKDFVPNTCKEHCGVVEVEVRLRKVVVHGTSTPKANARRANRT